MDKLTFMKRWMMTEFRGAPVKWTFSATKGSPVLDSGIWQAHPTDAEWMYEEHWAAHPELAR